VQRYLWPEDVSRKMVPGAKSFKILPRSKQRVEKGVEDSKRKEISFEVESGSEKRVGARKKARRLANASAARKGATGLSLGRRGSLVLVKIGSGERDRWLDAGNKGLNGKRGGGNAIPI